MNYHLRWILAFLANVLLILLLGEVNHVLAIWSLHVFLVGLLLTFGILRLRLKQGLLVSGLTGLILDATNPLPFGFTLFLILFAHTIAFSVRGNFARDSLRSALWVATGINVALMIALGLFAGRGTPAPDVFWLRIGADGLLSTLVLVIVAPWFLSLQKTALAFIGIDLDAEQREAE